MKISWGKAASLALVWGRVASAQEASPEEGVRPESTPKAQTAMTAPATNAPEAEPAQDGPEPQNPEVPPEPSSSGSPTHAELTTWAADQSPKCKVRAVAETKDGYLLACG